MVPRRRREMIDVCGLGEMMHKDIGQLSKGYRQRVGLAAAMIHDPKVLILDEPTSGLDPNQIVEIRTLIHNIGKEKTVVLSTHILPEVTATCTRVVIINRGKIAADAPIADLQRGIGGGDRIALEVVGETRTYAELDAATDRAAAGFAALGLQPGDKACLMMRNSAANVEAWLGLCKAGIVEVPIFVVPEKSPVKFRMYSTDVIHSFWVPDFRVKFDVFPNRYTSVWFEPTGIEGTARLPDAGGWKKWAGTPYQHLMAPVR